MNSFDFSLYDPLDETVIDSKKNVTTKPTKKSEPFNFDKYDLTEFYQTAPTPEVDSEKQDKVYQMYATPEKTPEELKKMTAQEKREYVQDLKTEREYQQSAGFTKNALSGATFGISENIDALKPQPHELNQGIGHLVGSALPISLSAKAVGVPLKAAYEGSKGIKALERLTRSVHAAGTGAAYETAQQTVNLASGKDFDPAAIPTTAAIFTLGDLVVRGIIKAGSSLYNRFNAIPPKQQAKILQDRVIPEDLPKSQEETAQEFLNLLKKEDEKLRFLGDPNFPPGGPPPPPGASPPSGLRSQPGGIFPQGRNVRVDPSQDLGLRPIPQNQNPNLKDQVGNIFSQNRYYNTTQAGQALKNEVMNLDEDVYRGVGELYNRSRELNAAINEIHPQLAQRLTGRLQELEAIPQPSGVQSTVIRTANNILDSIATRDAEGIITGYQPINNQTLIDQIQSLRQIIDYDFAHGNTKNIFRPLINDIQDSVLRAAENSGNQEAATAFNEARTAYRTWVEAFDNDYIRPFRDVTNQDFSKLFKSSLDLDEANMLNRILGISERGQELANASTREIVEKNLSKYFENPRKIDGRELDKSLRELRAIITPEQEQAIRTQLDQAARKPSFKAKEEPKRKPTNDEIIAAKFADKEPQDIMRMMNTRTGIKELRKLADTKAKKEVFDRLSKQKMRSIMRDGNIEKDFSGDDLYRFLNKEKNYEIFSELLGEVETEALRLEAKEIGKSQVKKEMQSKSKSSLLKKYTSYKTIELLLGLL